jgi:hypothetical protein
MQLEIHESAVYCLKAAVKSGELPGAVDCKELAHFLYSERVNKNETHGVEV